MDWNGFLSKDLARVSGKGAKSFIYLMNQGEISVHTADIPSITTPIQYNLASLYCHTWVQLGIQPELNSGKYHLASWARKWHDYVPVDHHPPTRRVT